MSWAISPTFYMQLGLVFFIGTVAFSISYLLKKNFVIFRDIPTPGRLFLLKKQLYLLRIFLFPLFSIILLQILLVYSEYIVQETWLIQVAQNLNILLLIYTIIIYFIANPVIQSLVTWIAMPIAILQVFGWLDTISVYLDTIDMQVGNIRLSLYNLSRTIIIAVVLFYLGQFLNRTGQQIIYNAAKLEINTREIFAKLFQIILIVVTLILLLQAMGINLTAFAVFGGAVGIGLGFGLQAIASNFISGLIIILDRSVTVGDYIEFEDGQTGIIREFKMRSAILETFDGKDIVVPNERFITSKFINWTHKNKKQRYAINFQVAYSTDLHQLFALLREVVANHPKVLSGKDVPLEEQPDAEIAGFGDSGVDILIEFWMEGIDDGKNRVGADLLLMIWDAFKEHGITFPFPQREVKILNTTEHNQS